MSSEEVRKKFLDFFVSRGHAQVPSSSLVPDDPSVLLTPAGMQQFKPYFTGELNAIEDFGSLNTVSVQKSFRTSDIEETGDNTHLTFFEMLGNFSFGGYFKREAITYAYEFITKELKLPISYVTIFKGSEIAPKDEESRQIWQELGVTDIREEGMHDVFWGPTGSAGPCGPTTEIYCKNAEGKDVENWNIVFNQFYYPGSREELLSGASDKKLKPLKTQGIDTGAGFERLVTVLQKKKSVYETDIFVPLIDAIKNAFKKDNASVDAIPEKVVRIFADHIRASIFLIADGVRPSNKEAGYILRRLLRRMLAYKIAYDIHGDVFGALFPVIQSKFETWYPEIGNPEILSVIQEEEEKFGKAITSGLLELKKHSSLTAEEAFALSSTYGINFELMKEMAPEAMRNVTDAAFQEEFKKHQEISRAGSTAKFGGHGLYLKTGEVTIKDASEVERVTKLHTATHLLHAALRAILGEEVRQDGSDITVERTRFDFRFGRKVSPEELQKVEDWVNEAIKKDLKVVWEEKDYNQAVKEGALGFFKAKYPPRVKVYTISEEKSGDVFSKEFCGGPHVTHTGEIGRFKILKEESAAAGIRRIRANIE